MKTVYIVLIKAHTGLGAVARRITGYPYTHIAVSLDRSMEDFLSFSRRRHYFPFDAGFTHETRSSYAFGEHECFKAKIFALPVSDQAFSEITSYIAECERDKKRVFNLFSMATMPIIGGFRIWHADNCMSFTSKVIQLSGCAEMQRPYWRYSIKDIDKLLCSQFFFEGKMQRLLPPDDDYMEPFDLGLYLKDMLSLFGKLTYRLIFKRP